MVDSNAIENTPEIGDLIGRQEAFIGDDDRAVDVDANVHDSTFWRDQAGFL